MQRSHWSRSCMVKDTSAEWLHPNMGAECLKSSLVDEDTQHTLPYNCDRDAYSFSTRGRSAAFVLFSLKGAKERSHASALQLFSWLKRHDSSKKHKQIQILFEGADQRWIWQRRNCTLYCLLSLHVFCCLKIRLLWWRVVTHSASAHLSSPASSPTALSQLCLPHCLLLQIVSFSNTFNQSVNSLAGPELYTVNLCNVDLPLRNRVTDWYLSELCWWPLKPSSALTWISSTSCLSVSTKTHLQTQIITII